MVEGCYFTTENYFANVNDEKLHLQSIICIISRFSHTKNKTFLPAEGNIESLSLKRINILVV